MPTIEREAHAGGRRIAYDVTGPPGGPVVVLVPGLLMHRGRWHEEGYVGRLVAAGHRVVAVDPLGHGTSDAPHDAAAYGPAATVAQVIAVLDAEDVARAALWGYSRGAVVAAAVAAAAPDRVVATVCGALPDDPAAVGREMDVDALAAGDWDGYWSAFPVPLPADVRAGMEAANDPQAIAAAVLGLRTATPHRPAGGPPQLVYVGDAAAFGGGGGPGTAPSGPTERVVLPTGGHAETFRAAAACWAVVAPFLGAAFGGT